MSRNLHSTEFKEQALIKVRERGTRSVQDIANDLNMNVGTLRKWTSKSNRKVAASDPKALLPDDLPAPSWTIAQRFQALLETHAMPAMQLHAWCREKGLFEHQLKAWRDAFCNASTSDSRESKLALRELQTKHEGLQRELRRKEKALAEAAALLVLQKKFQALWEDEEK
jgi:transposase-like protein